MAEYQPIKVLSLNVYMMGHVTYQNTLERIFLQHLSEIEFHSLHLSDYYKKDLLGKIVYWFLTKKINHGGADYDFYRFRTQLAISFFARRYLEGYLKIYQPTVIHLHTQGIALLADYLLRKFPSVISIDYTTASLAKEHPSPASITYQPIVALERKCFQSATHIVTWSARARYSVINDYGIAPEKVTHIDCPLLLDEFTYISRDRAMTLSKPRLLFVGNDFVRKGGEDLLAVFLEHFSEICELDLVTNAPVNAPEIPNLRIHQGIRPLSAELLHLYQAADIFVMPTHEEAYGIVFQEAMAAGLPCIGTTTMAVPELIQNGRNGFTIPPRDRQALFQVLHKLVNDTDLRLSMGLAGREIAKQRFDPIMNGKQLAKIFASCARQVNR
jgi:glycosyltransferase involved in cell wall biosynthesis